MKRASASSFASVTIAILALVVSVSSTATAAILISGADIKNNSITTKDIKNRSITAKDIKKGSLKSKNVKDGSLKVKDMSAQTRVAMTGSQGPAGPRGAAGPEGPPGQQGPEGPAGPSGVESVETVTVVGEAIAPGAISTVNAFCPEGSSAVGGGAAWTGIGSLLSNLSRSLPVVATRAPDGTPTGIDLTSTDDADAWTASGINTDLLNAQTLQTTVLCVA